jgi:hypothetical protein
MATEGQIKALLQRMREMSAADISILQASTKTPGSSMTTAPGSHNEVLWSEMVGLEWMMKRDEDLELLLPLAGCCYSFHTVGPA